MDRRNFLKSLGGVAIAAVATPATAFEEFAPKFDWYSFEKRRLILKIIDAMTDAGRKSLFEFNDEITRNQYTQDMHFFLRDLRVQLPNLLADYRVICDETNNSPSVIDDCDFVADVYLKFQRDIDPIILNFSAQRYRQFMTTEDYDD